MGQGAFGLNLPSRGAINNPAATGSLGGVKINEWLASSSSSSDYFELFNTGSLPVLLGGNYLTDTLSNENKFLIAPLSFIGGAGNERWLQFVADNNSSMPGHVNFALKASGEELGFFTAGGILVDGLAFGSQTSNVSQGLYPDGVASVLSMLPTPGAMNVIPEPDSDSDGMPDWWEDDNELNRDFEGDAVLDADHDGMSNLDEYQAGTDPNDGGVGLPRRSRRMEACRRCASLLRPGRGYSVQFSDALGSWSKLADVSPQASTGEVAVADPGAVGETKRFYRIITPAVP